MNFYHYSQNYTYASFIYDEEAGISANVIIEADNPIEADYHAEEIGLYFDENDCDCCGERWNRKTDIEGSDKPRVYDKLVYPDSFYPEERSLKRVNGYEGFIHYSDGKIAGFWK